MLLVRLLWDSMLLNAVAGLFTVTGLIAALVGALIWTVVNLGDLVKEKV